MRTRRSSVSRTRLRWTSMPPEAESCVQGFQGLVFDERNSHCCALQCVSLAFCRICVNICSQTCTATLPGVPVFARLPRNTAAVLAILNVVASNTRKNSEGSVVFIPRTAKCSAISSRLLSVLLERIIPSAFPALGELCFAGPEKHDASFCCQRLSLFYVMHQVRKDVELVSYAFLPCATLMFMLSPCSCHTQGFKKSVSLLHCSIERPTVRIYLGIDCSVHTGVQLVHA